MPRVHHVKKARKDNDRCGVKAGESYYWWGVRFPGRKAGYKRCSKERPTARQLERNPYRLALMDIEDMFTALANASSVSDIEAEIGDIVSAIEALADEQQEKMDNMPENFQQGDIYYQLEERKECLQGWASDLAGWSSPALPDLDDLDCDGYDDKDICLEDHQQEQVTEAVDELRNMDPGCA